MEPRLKYPKVVPSLMQAMSNVEAEIARVGVEPSLLELVRMRASQINGCAYCLDAHWRDSKAAGLSDQRLYSLPAWRETPFYTERERAALALCEAMTDVSGTHVPDEVFAAARPHFSDEHLVTLAWAIAAINTWNRMAVTFRAVPRAATP
ncbi:MAG TPA: carboxymuconolactone decarboxylase family protein [Phycisphaerales bacterium]|nr:carboxymuconolactone decarboxylase family protein [Phycisphaerales bacterium]